MTLKNVELAQKKKTNTRKTSSSFDLKKTITPLLFIVFIALLSYIFFQKYLDSSPEKRLETLENHFINLENRIAKIEDIVGKLSALEDQRTKFEISLMNRIEGFETMAAKYTKQLSQEEVNPHQEARAETIVEKKSPEKETRKAGPVKYHNVASGETLYRISLKYGLTVAALREINDIGPEAVIFVGQKLRVSN